MSGRDAGGLGRGRQILPLPPPGSNRGQADIRQGTALWPLPAALPDFFSSPGACPVGFPQGTLCLEWLLPPTGSGAEVGPAPMLTPLGFSLPALALSPVSHSTDGFKPHLVFQRVVTCW